MRKAETDVQRSFKPGQQSHTPIHTELESDSDSVILGPWMLDLKESPTGI